MPDYKKILLVVDLSDDSQLVGERAKAIAACYGSEITLLHVVEYVPVEPMGEALLPTVQIESEESGVGPSSRKAAPPRPADRERL
jgi:universal stress protein A